MGSEMCIRDSIAGSSPPLPTTVRALHFHREKISALSILVDSRRIVPLQFVLFIFLVFSSGTFLSHAEWPAYLHCILTHGTPFKHLSGYLLFSTFGSSFGLLPFASVIIV